MTRVQMQINAAQARCFAEYRCLVLSLPRDQDIPVGHPVTVMGDGMEQGQETFIIARQAGQNGVDLYVLAHATDVNTVH